MWLKCSLCSKNCFLPFLLLAIFFEPPITRTFFVFPWRFKLSGVGCMGYDQYTVSWHCSCRTYFCCVALLLTNIHMYHPWSLVPLFLISLNNSELRSKPPTKPFGIVTCTFSDNLSQNSCISRISSDNVELYLHVTYKLHSMNNLLIIITVSSKT